MGGFKRLQVGAKDWEEFSPDYRFLFKSIPNCETAGCHLDVYLPKDTSRLKSAPIAIVIHGGAFTTGASSDIPHNQVRYLLASGFVVCSPEYRLSPHVLQSAAHEDVFDSYLYIQRELQGVLREQGNPITLDLERCYSQGGSAGGTSALRLAVDIDTYNQKVSSTRERLPQLRAVVPAYPCTDVRNWNDKPQKDLLDALETGPSDVRQTIEIFRKGPVSTGFRNSTPPGHPRLIWRSLAFKHDCLNSFLFGDAPFPKEASVVNLVNERFPPTFILFAEKDGLIPPKQSYQLNEALQKAGVETHVEVFRGADHGFTKWNPMEKWPSSGEWWDSIVKSLDFAIQKTLA